MMTRRHFFTALPAASVLAAARAPNLVFVFCDQLRSSALGCMGNPAARTPNLDRLAAQGILLRNNFSCTPVCSPFRGQLMTGRFPWHNGVTRNGAEVNTESKTIAEILSARGYRTGFIGKWHLYRQSRETKGTPASEFVPPQSRRGWQFWAATNNGQHAASAVAFHDSPQPISIPDTEIAWQTRTAIGYFEKNKNNPFCLMIAYNPPHVPLTPISAAARIAESETLVPPNVPAPHRAEASRMIARYLTTVAVIDSYIGQLLQSLDRLGLARDTVFAFTSDHGLMMHSQGESDKQRPWDESARTPFMVRFPRDIPAGRASTAPTSSVDLMPTMLGLLGVPAPSNVDGLDLSPLLRGTSTSEPHSVYLSQRSFGGGPGFDWQGVVTSDWKYARRDTGHWLLYNRANDPYELQNLIADPAHAATLARMSALASTWRDRSGDTRPLASSNSPGSDADNRKARKKGRN